ncbi:MAG: gamma-glutamylcyclotransferase family protein [Xanthomonadales bacterium]|nr:gamma-glutamylcyclotransferase family protein [Xanthomonadales bacterium]
MPVKYAAYGSNLHPVRLRERTGEVRLLGTAAVDHLALKFHKRGNVDGSAKCDIVEARGSRVHLAVFEIPDAGLENLDIAEGVGSGYTREHIEVPGFGRCLTYRAQASHIDDSLKPFDWYKRLVLAGCRYHGFPAAYLEAIEAVQAVIDPDPDRHAAHELLLQKLI